MTFVSIAALAVAAISLSIAAGVIRWTVRALDRKERVHDQRVTDLLDRTMHVVNKTWEPPPYARTELEGEDARQAARSRMFDGIVEDPEYAPTVADELIEMEDRRAEAVDAALAPMVADPPLAEIT